VVAFAPLVLHPSRVVLVPETSYTVTYRGGPLPWAGRADLHYAAVASLEGFAQLTLNAQGKPELHLVAGQTEGCRNLTLTVGNKEARADGINALADEASATLCILPVGQLQLHVSPTPPSPEVCPRIGTQEAIVTATKTFEVAAVPLTAAGEAFHNARYVGQRERRPEAKAQPGGRGHGSDEPLGPMGREPHVPKAPASCGWWQRAGLQVEHCAGGQAALRLCG
jgi:hypothetical protein